MQVNEALIREIFSGIVEYRPTLNNYIAAEEDDDVDFRILGDLIIRSYPWPVGVELRRLFSGSMRQLDRMRLDQIFKTLERSIQFISFVMTAELWQKKREQKIEIPDNIKEEFKKRFSILTMGNFSWVIRNICKIFRDNQLTWFMPEMGENFDDKFLNELDFWVPERNDIGHYQINLTQEEIEKRCVEFCDKLAYVLIKIAFLTKYKLISVRDIRVKKTMLSDSLFSHTIDLLNSSDSDFKAKEMEDADYTESNAILLTKSTKKIEEYINLSPLVIDTHSETIDSKEKFSVKKDIFLFTKYKNEQLSYLGTEITEKCDLKSLSNYEQLKNEFNEMIHIITG